MTAWRGKALVFYQITLAGGEYASNMAQHHEGAIPRAYQKKVGGSLKNVCPLKRIAMMQRNALLLRGGKWKAPEDDGTLVRKVVGDAM